MPSPHFTDFVQELAARTEIEDTLKRFIRAVDRQDWAEARATYHRDAIDEHGFFSGGADAFVDFLARVHAEQDHSMHFLSNILIEFGSADAALVESYCLVVQRFDAASGEAPAGSHGVRKFGSSRYVDRFEKRDGAWKVAHRTLILGDLESGAIREPLTFPPGFTMQRHDMTDRLYALRSAFFGSDTP